MDMKEKLVELLSQVQYQGNAVHGYHDKYILNSELADNLIANGVTFATDNNVGSKWIPVTERLPKNFISVLVHIPEMNPCPAVMEAYRFDDGWVTKMAAFDINCATHWMPLPTAPEGE